MSKTIAQAFSEAKEKQRLAFMPFVSAGDPDLPTTAEILTLLSSCGADLIEVGFPYSDPIADGPVIQSAYSRALATGISNADIFEAIKTWTDRTNDHPPLVAMVSYSIVFRQGIGTFLAQASDAGFSGLIVPDLPGDAAGELSAAAANAGLDLIPLLAPTTSANRAEAVVANGRGFVYCISVAGTTGERTSLPAQLRDQLQSLRDKTDLPLAVGFGISKPEQIADLQSDCDGVIVGSALVRRVEQLSTDGDRDEFFAETESYVRSMIAACGNG